MCKFLGKGYNNKVLQTSFSKKFYFFALRINQKQILSGSFGEKHFTRMRMKCDQYTFTPDFARNFINTVYYRFMTNMHAIETACGYNRIRYSSKLIKVVKNPHVKYAVAC